MTLELKMKLILKILVHRVSLNHVTAHIDIAVNEFADTLVKKTNSI